MKNENKDGRSGRGKKLGLFKDLDPGQRDEFRRIKGEQGIGAARDFARGLLGAPGAGSNWPAVEQKIPEVALGLLGQMGSQPAFSTDSLPQIPGIDDFSAERQRVSDTIYKQAASRLDPRYAREEENFRQRMADMGISEGSDVYKDRFKQFIQNKNDAYQQAGDQAYLAGGQEQQRMYGMGADAYSRALTGKLAEYEVPTQQLNALSPYYQPYAQAGLLGLNNQFDQQKLALQHQYNLEEMKAAPRGGGGGGGGGGGTDPIALLNAKTQAEKDLLAFQYANDPRYSQGNGKSGTNWGGLLGGIAGSFASGFGNSFGAGLGKSWGS